MSGRPGFIALAALSLALVPGFAQTKPPESSSKVKKVLLYNKIGGWLTMIGIESVKETFSRLAAAKGFELVQTANDGLLTPDYLRQFQVIVWNNNTNGLGSVPSAEARLAVVEYLQQGGGWMLIHKAADHAHTWPELSILLGTDFTYNANGGFLEVVLDSSARAHPELKWMVHGLPEAFQLNDLCWIGFERTVRHLPEMTVVATLRPSSTYPMGGLPKPADGSGDAVYQWAREFGKGRLIYNALSCGGEGILQQQDSIVPRLYWENLRYAAGDFQNGCADPGSPGFDPAARVHDEERCGGTGVEAAPPAPQLIISRGNLRMRLAAPEGVFRVRLRDLRGALVWERTLPAGAGEVALDGAVGPGVYHMEVQGAAGMLRRRLALP